MNKGIRIDQQSIFKMAWPIFIEVFLQMLVGNVDQFMISQYSQPSVAAIGNANQVMNIVIILLTVFTTATTILIAQYLGAQNKDKISEVCTVSLAVNGVFSLLSGAALIAFCRPLFQWMQVPESIMEETCQYLMIVAGGILFQGLYFSFVSCFRGYSWTKTTMLVSVIMNALNIFGNWLLIYGFWSVPAMGVIGVAISTNISKLLGLIFIFWIFKRYLGVAISWRFLYPFPTATFKQLLRIGLPSGGEALSYQTSQTVIMKMVNIFGLVVINTKVYVYIIAMFCYVYALAISAALQIVVGFLIGAGRLEDVTSRVWKTMRAAVWIGTSITVLLYMTSDMVFRVFTDQPEVLKLGKQILLVEIFLEIGRAVNIVMVRALQAAGDIKTPITVGIVCMWSIAVTMGYFLGVVLDWGLVGIWIGMALDECTRAVIFIYRWKSGAWQNKRLI